MNDGKKPENGEEIESWFIDEEITQEDVVNTGIKVDSVSLHGETLNTVTSVNDAAIIGEPALIKNDENQILDMDHSGKDLYVEATTIRKSILEDLKDSPGIDTDPKESENTDIPDLETPDLVATRADNTRDTVFPEKSSTSTTMGSKLSNLDTAPEYLQEENPQSTAERRYEFISPTSPQKNSVEGADLTWTEPETVKNPATPSLEETIFEGATVVPTIPSRAAAHLWSLLLTLLLLPLAWYYAIDVAQRLRVGPNSPWQGGPITATIIAELIGASICIFLVVFIARFSSLGTFFTGLIFTAAGIFTVFTPHLAATKLAPVFRALEHSNTENSSLIQNFMTNIGHLLHLSAGSGLFLFIGIILLALGFVSHGARRKGRKDYLINRKVEDFT